MSTESSDLQALTPSHFPIGRPLVSVEADLTDVNVNRLNRYQLLERMRQTFWKRWSAELLNFRNEPSGKGIQCSRSWNHSCLAGGQYPANKLALGKSSSRASR